MLSGRANPPGGAIVTAVTGRRVHEKRAMTATSGKRRNIATGVAAWYGMTVTYPNDPFSSAGGAPNPYSNPFGNQPPPASPFQGGGHQFPPADPSFGQFPPVFQAGYPPAGPPPEPPRKKRKVWLVLTVVAAVVVASAGIGTVLWWLNRGGGAGEVTAAGGGPLPASVPPLGDLRPPADVALPSLEQPISAPRWTYDTGIDAYVLGGERLHGGGRVGSRRDGLGQGDRRTALVARGQAAEGEYQPVFESQVCHQPYGKDHRMRTQSGSLLWGP